MLKQEGINAARASRRIRREQRLWHDSRANMLSIGCTRCGELALCGGLRVSAALFDCLNYCCGAPANCDRVCRSHPSFADRVREVATLSLDNVPRSRRIESPPPPTIVPMVFHGHSRRAPLTTPAVALPLYSMFDRRDGRPRFVDRQSLCAAFGIAPSCLVVLSGTATDPPIERWWGLGEDARRLVIRSLVSANVSLVTTPNYSVFSDQPRWGDMHAMKRIAITHSEFLDEGLQAALHVNGRTERDLQRWTEYVGARQEVKYIAYEFTTGTRLAGRREQHAAWLAKLAVDVGRPLHLVLRGGVELLPMLRQTFCNVTMISTTPFMKAMMRKEAIVGDGTTRWRDAPTPPGSPLDDLLAANIEAISCISSTMA